MQMPNKRKMDLLTKDTLSTNTNRFSEILLKQLLFWDEYMLAILDAGSSVSNSYITMQ